MGKTLKNILYAGAFAFGVGLFSGCEKPADPEPEPTKDTTPPIITISSPLENEVYNSKTIPFSWVINEQNFKSAYYTTDNGQTKNPIGKSGTKNIEYSNGKKKLILYADDKSANSSTATVNFEIDKTGGIVVNPFVQPNDSTLDWYGSGDGNGNNTLDLGDLTVIDGVIDRSYSNPSDTRLIDKLNVNGSIDEVVNSDDRKILSDRILGLLPYLPGEWNKLQTRAERVDWVLKMFDIDKTNLSGGAPEYSCVNFTYKANINFKGYSNPEDISNILKFYNFSFADNGRFNLPLYELHLVHYNSEGIPTDAHDMNAIFVGDSAPNYNNLIRMEPQNDAKDPPLGEGYLAPFGTNSELFVRGSPITDGAPKNISSMKYITYKVENGNVTLESVNPDIDLVTEREK